MFTKRSSNGRAIATAIAGVVAAVALGCGDSGPSHPDTGAGAGQTPPANENCVDLCQRLGDCVVTLCDEDTKSMNYDGLGPLLVDQCTSSCTDAQVQSGILPAAWMCIFQMSCRQVFEHDACHAMSHYNCS